MRARLIGLCTLLFLVSACAAPASQPAAGSAPATTAVAQEPTAEPTASPSATMLPTVTAAPEPTALPSPSPSATALPTSTPSAPPPTPSSAVQQLVNQPDVFAFLDHEAHLRLATPDGQTATIWDEERVEGMDWAPDGKRVAFISSGSLYVWAADTEQTTALLPASQLAGTPSWAADALHIAVTRLATAGAACSEETPCQILLVDTTNGTSWELGPGSNPLFAPVGTALMAATLSPMLPIMRESDLTSPIVWPSPETQPITVSEATSVADWSRVAWSADGSLVAVHGLLLDNTGRVVEQLGELADVLATDGPFSISNGIAPDGQAVAIATLAITMTDDGFESDTRLSVLDRATGLRRDIWRYDPDAQQAERDAPQPGPTWRITQRTTTRITGHGRYWRVSPVDWTPDGNTLAFTGCGVALVAEHSRGCGLWVGAGNGSALRLLTAAAGAEDEEQTAGMPHFSPDGTQVLVVRYDQPETPNLAIWAYSIADDTTPRLVVAGNTPRWRP